MKFKVTIQEGESFQGIGPTEDRVAILKFVLRRLFPDDDVEITFKKAAR